MNYEYLKSLRDIGIIVTSLIVASYYTFTWFFSIVFRMFVTIGNSKSKIIGIGTALVYIIAFGLCYSIVSLISGKIVFNFKNVVFLIWIIILISLILCFQQKLNYWVNNTLERSTKYEYNKFSNHSTLCLMPIFISGIISYFMIYDMSTINISSIIKIFIIYILSICSGGLINSYSRVCGLYKMIIYIKDLDKYNLAIDYNDELSTNGLRKIITSNTIIGFLISEDKKSVIIKPDNCCAIWLKKELIDIMVPFEQSDKMLTFKEMIEIKQKELKNQKVKK